MSELVMERVFAADVETVAMLEDAGFEEPDPLSGQMTNASQTEEPERGDDRTPQTAVSAAEGNTR